MKHLLDILEAFPLDCAIRNYPRRSDILWAAREPADERSLPSQCFHHNFTQATYWHIPSASDTGMRSVTPPDAFLSSQPGSVSDSYQCYFIAVLDQANRYQRPETLTRLTIACSGPLPHNRRHDAQKHARHNRGLPPRLLVSQSRARAAIP